MADERPDREPEIQMAHSAGSDGQREHAGPGRGGDQCRRGLAASAGRAGAPSRPRAGSPGSATKAPVVSTSIPIWPDPRCAPKTSVAMRRHLQVQYDAHGLGRVPEPECRARSGISPYRHASGWGLSLRRRPSSRTMRCASRSRLVSMAYFAQIIITSWRADVRAARRWGSSPGYERSSSAASRERPYRTCSFSTGERRRQAIGERAALAWRTNVTTSASTSGTRELRARLSGEPAIDPRM